MTTSDPGGRTWVPPDESAVAATAGMGEPTAYGGTAEPGEPSTYPAASGHPTEPVPHVTAVESGAEGIGSTLDSRSTVDEMRDRGRTALAVLVDFAREQPAAFLAGAVVAGVVARRILSGSREDD